MVDDFEPLADDSEPDEFSFDDDTDFDDFDYEESLVPATASPTTEAIENMVGNLIQTADVDAAFGVPVHHGDTVIIPAAEVMAVLGFGMGGGPIDEDGSTSGEGGGGGGSSFSRPVAVIISGPHGVRIEPVMDLTKIALAGISAGVFMIGMMARLQKSRREFRRLKRRLGG